jgi:hypothetical protein
MSIRVVNVKGMNTPEKRAAVCYVGRRFAGWPHTPFGNHGHHGCPGEFRAHLKGLPPDQLNNMLHALWEACDRGAKPLGCWCLEWAAGGGPTPGCHAAVWAELLAERFAPAAVPPAPVAPPLKCLTINQPWAWAIFHAGKCVENRTWYTPHRGPLLVHAGVSRRWYDAEDPEDWREVYGVALPAWAALPTGAVLGVADLVGCVRPGSAPAGPWAEGPWCWVLARPRAFAEPVPLRGQQGLFGVPPDLIPAEYRS